MATSAQKWNPIDVITELEVGPKNYRLWFETPITAGNDIVILVHGAVIPVPGAFHDPTTINSCRYCFYDLDSLLYQDFQYNIFTFEYADECIKDPITQQCIPNPDHTYSFYNYGDLRTYGGELKEAIGFAKTYSKNQGPVTIIAHSIGGLIARYANTLADGEIKTIITLDTGHKGFALANFVVNLLNAAHIALPAGTQCTQEAEVGSAFINALNTNVDLNNPKLVSLAATQAIPAGFFIPPHPPLPGILPTTVKVVDSDSSNMGEVHSLDYHHATISKITDRSHGAYQIIIGAI